MENTPINLKHCLLKFKMRQQPFKNFGHIYPLQPMVAGKLNNLNLINSNKICKQQTLVNYSKNNKNIFDKNDKINK